MNKTKIEWCDYTCNPIKGYCPVGCSYCYARAMYDRLGWDKTIRYDYGAWVKGVNILTLSKPSRIFVGSTIELFGEWVKPHWLQDIFLIAKAFPQHTFIFLTKRPWELPKWNPWPDNAWVGATAVDEDTIPALNGLALTDARVRFLSVEPLLGRIPAEYLLSAPKGVEMFNPNWLIIGAQTKPYKPPKSYWVEEIIDAADGAGIRIFLKDNLKWPYKRQEYPKAVMDE